MANRWYNGDGRYNLYGWGRPNDEYDWNGNGYFQEGLAKVRLDDFHWAWIDKKGKEVVVFDHCNYW